MTKERDYKIAMNTIYRYSMEKEKPANQTFQVLILAYFYDKARSYNPEKVLAYIREANDEDLPLKEEMTKGQQQKIISRLKKKLETEKRINRAFKERVNQESLWI